MNLENSAGRVKRRYSELFVLYVGGCVMSGKEDA